MTFAANAFAGRRVLVTGGSRGIGAACCRLFAAGGATVGVHYHREEAAARRIAAELAGGDERDHLVVSADLSEAAGAQSLLETAGAQWGGLDILVNNAGIWVRNRLQELDGEALTKTVDLNLLGVVHCTSEALPLLERSTNPAIINISSTAGQRGEADYSPYAATKGALISLTKSWAVELAPSIRVNAVAPGWVDTEMSEAEYRGSGREKITSGIPLNRIASAEDIASTVLFLASPAARHVTGEVLNVNGGSVLCG